MKIQNKSQESPSPAKIEDWQKILQRSPKVTKGTAKRFHIPQKWLQTSSERLPFQLNDYWAGLIQSADDPIGKQTLPSEEELSPKRGDLPDPLQEEKHRKAPLIIHRYRERVLFLVSNTCPVYCRFCTRRRLVGRAPFPASDQMSQSFNYLREHREIREVILSGGDPLILSDHRLGWILENLQAIEHVKILRIGTRVPATLPQRITESLVALLKNFNPLYILTQFNHPREITEESREACARLANAGIPMLNQSVLLKEVNDDPEIMLELMQKLVEIRIIPYYLHQLDPVQGAGHFEVSIEKGREIIRYLRKHTGGIAVPAYVFDDPEAPSKVPLA